MDFWHESYNVKVMAFHREKYVEMGGPFGGNGGHGSDIVFVVVCAVKIVPNFEISSLVWILMGSILLVKIINLISSIVIYGAPKFPHTAMNKITGVMVFILFLVPKWIPFETPAVICCCVALFAAVQEGHFIRTRRIAQTLETERLVLPPFQYEG